MVGGTGNAGALDNYRVQPTHPPRFGFARVVLTELRRAVAAERRHSELRHMDTTSLAREGITRADVPRRIFEEYYSSKESERAPKGAVHQRDASCPAPSLRFLAREDKSLGHRWTGQQQIIDLVWRRVLAAAICRLRTPRVIDALKSFEKSGLSETSGAEFGALR
jgi:hypothetical protein